MTSDDLQAICHVLQSGYIIQINRLDRASGAELPIADFDKIITLDSSNTLPWKGERKVGGKRYEARSRRRLSPDTLAF